MPQASGSRRLSPKNILLQLLKLGLAAAVVVYLVERGDIAWEPLRASLAEWRYSVPAFLILAVTPMGQAWRWQLLLRAGGVRVSNREVFTCLMVSRFFNMAFPGYVSGDILRGVYIVRRAAAESGSQSAAATDATRYSATQTVVASITFDRAAGLFPLFVFSLLGLMGIYWYPLPASLVLWVAAVAGGGVLSMAGLFVYAHWRSQPPSILLRLSRLLRAEEHLRYLHEISNRYARDVKLMMNILGLSFLTQAGAVLGFVLFGQALKVHLPLMAYLIVVPLGTMFLAIPIAPAGLGVGQVAFLSLFHMIGSVQGANLFTLFMVSSILVNCIGGVLYLGSGMPSPLSPQTDAAPPSKT